jgi:hypothetical protein
MGNVPSLTAANPEDRLSTARMFKRKMMLKAAMKLHRRIADFHLSETRIT